MQDAKITKAQNVTEIEALLQEPSFNQARALELVQQKTSMINEKAPLVITSLAVFLDSLTVEQKQQMQEFIQHRHQHHRHGDKD
jgi:Spy/CpxP family protein refolding chaperone